MKGNTFHYLVFFLYFCFSFIIIGISEDYSENLVKEVRQNRDYTSLEARQQIYDLGCVTLDCAVEKMINKNNPR